MVKLPNKIQSNCRTKYGQTAERNIVKLPNENVKLLKILYLYVLILKKNLYLCSQEKLRFEYGA